MQESQRHGISLYNADPAILAKKHDSVLQGLGNQVGRFEVLAAMIPLRVLLLACRMSMEYGSLFSIPHLLLSL